MKSTRDALIDRAKSVDRGNLRGCIHPPARRELGLSWRPRWMRLAIVRYRGIVDSAGEHRQGQSSRLFIDGS